MPQLPPLLRDQRKVDESHLELLAIFHFVGAGLGLLGILFLVGHYAVMSVFLDNPAMWQKGDPPPEMVFSIFKWFYAVMGAFFAACSALNVASGIALLRRRARVFSIVVAGINCIHLPLGTLLGVFTIIVLSRDSVIELYNATGCRDE